MLSPLPKLVVHTKDIYFSTMKNVNVFLLKINIKHNL